MKKIILLIISLLPLLSWSTKAQFTFGVTPGISLNGATFGYKTGKTVLSIGLQYLTTSVSMTESGKEYDYNSGTIRSYSDESKLSLTVFNPYVGAKFFVIEKESIKGFIDIAVSKPLFWGKDKFNNVSDSLFNKQLKANSVWGFRAGFGAEYFFSPHFGISAETGIRVFTNRYTFEDANNTIYDPNTGNQISAPIEFKASAIASWMFTSFGLNYYF